MEPDAHQTRDRYLIRSVYFDTLDNACFYENEAGVDARHKYRIRTYDNRSNELHLEIKSKLHGYCHKDQCLISRELFDQVMNGELPAFRKDFSPVMNRFYLAIATQLLHPVAIIQYERSAFVYPQGNVRITFDRNISVSACLNDFFSPNLSAVPVQPGGKHLLEVKYDEFLPDYIAQVLELGNLQQITFSKYYLGRLALAY